MGNEASSATRAYLRKSSFLTISFNIKTAYWTVI
jgi:hypothetical protein